MAFRAGNQRNKGPIGPRLANGKFMSKSRRARKNANRSAKARTVIIKETKSFQPPQKKQQMRFGKNVPTFSGMAPAGVSQGMRGNMVTFSHNVRNKEYGDGLCFNFCSYMGYVTMNSSQTYVFVPTALLPGLGSYPNYYITPIHPSSYAFLSGLSVLYGRYAFTDIKIQYKPSSPSTVGDAIAYAVNSDSTAMAGLRTGTYTSYSQTAPNLNYMLTQASHAQSIVWKPSFLRHTYRGDKTWLCTLPAADTGQTETLAAAEFEQWTQLNFLARTVSGGASATYFAGTFEMSGQICFYEPRSGTISLLPGVIGGSTTTTASSTMLSGTVTSDSKRLGELPIGIPPIVPVKIFDSAGGVINTDGSGSLGVYTTAITPICDSALHSIYSDGSTGALRTQIYQGAGTDALTPLHITSSLDKGIDSKVKDDIKSQSRSSSKERIPLSDSLVGKLTDRLGSWSLVRDPLDKELEKVDKRPAPPL